jgi:hypothetical protein
VTERAIKYASRLRAKMYRATKQFWDVVGQGVPTELELLAERSQRSSPLQLNPPSTPNAPTTTDAADETVNPGPPRILRAAVGGAPSAPRYIEDVVERARAAMRDSKGND